MLAKMGRHTRESLTMAPEFTRKNVRLPTQYYHGRRLYFVTLCFHNRRRFGANPRLAGWIVSRLREHSAACDFLVHAYCVMPDHMHVLAAGAAEKSNLTKFVKILLSASRRYCLR